MILIFGTRFFGRVDEVPGVFHVATKFAHVWYIPLIPMGSWLVTARERGAIHGVPVRLNGKSILMAWARAGLIAAAVISLIAAMAYSSDRRPQRQKAAVAAATALVCGGAAAATWLMPIFRRARYQRAARLVELAKLPEEVMVLIDVAFERISKEEAAQLLAELSAARNPVAVTAPAAGQ